MISIWWLLAAFIGGSWAGMLLMALMQMSADPSKQFGGPLDLDGTPPQTNQAGVLDGFRHVQLSRR
jgi:hypothetical protein